ncbi:MAG TPA: hypothetical protein VEL11_01095 [Candidatus Bathyarchaeia archaeon]|nr:hypothetical protein [Candidatus Bathyarchaeia archaeon]
MDVLKDIKQSNLWENDFWGVLAAGVYVASSNSDIKANVFSFPRWLNYNNTLLR